MLHKLADFGFNSIFKTGNRINSGSSLDYYYYYADTAA